MLTSQTIDSVRSLAAKLTPDERLTLIRVISNAATNTAATNTEEAPFESSDGIPENENDDRLDDTQWSARLKEEEAYWHSRSQAERAHYAGEYVAVYEKRVVDHDPDRRRLYLRIQKEYPDSPVLLTAAEAKNSPEFSIYSPRLDEA